MARVLARAVAGFIAAATVSMSGRRAGVLSADGALAATAVGGAVVAGVGFRRATALVAYFVSSSALSRLPTAVVLEQRRGSQRDAIQVLANGGIAALLALAAALAPQRVRLALEAGFGGAVAAAAADTWATEIGGRFGRQPRSIVTLTPVPPGSSGGVTLVGIAASTAGAAFVAGVLRVATPPRLRRETNATLAYVLGGFAGALTDSVLGATIQEVRWCDACLQETESLRHSCGGCTRPIRGAHWCDNDTVNAIATAIGAMVAIAVVSKPAAPAATPGSWHLQAARE
jgi:uncharacterized protein (TIGR00297 family)